MFDTRDLALLLDQPYHIQAIFRRLDEGDSMRFSLVGATCVATVLAAGSVAAQTCGGSYTVAGGDTLSGIANALYDDARKWSVIYNTNRALIGESPNRLMVGQDLNVPCIGGLPVLGGAVTATATQTSTPAASVQRALPGATSLRLLTAGDFAPFTDEALENGGLITEIVDASMQNAGLDGYSINWVNDWSSHLDPLLSNAMLDAGFPWYKPDCDGDPGNYRCENFHFSEPMFEMLILLFTTTANPITFLSDADIEGKTLCRPEGYFTHDLDKNGRNWVKDGKITLKQPDSVADCFEMLTAGEVDAVALNEFTGRTAIKEMGMQQTVAPVQTRPLSIEGLHVLVHKNHPNAQSVMAAINQGLAAIKENGTYQQVINRHMSRIWSEL